ncbi:MAG: hypothetical protein AABZ47_01555 [Planctomycetota bacterium]
MFASRPKLPRTAGLFLAPLFFGLACDFDPIDGESLCAIDSDCGDGIFCNGAETCVDGVCIPAVGPCTDPNRPICDESRMMCLQCDSDAACNDGLFCNGQESCTDGECQTEPSPCDEILGDCFDNGVCLEKSGECIAPCASDEDCDADRCMVARCFQCLCYMTPVICSAGMICDERVNECVQDETGVCVPDCEDPGNECFFGVLATYDDVLLTWNGFPFCVESEPTHSWHVGGVCNEGTLFVDTFDTLHHLVQFFDAETRVFSSMVFQSDAIDSTCFGLSYWPEYYRCENATVTTVICGNTYEVGDAIELPGDVRTSYFP